MKQRISEYLLRIGNGTEPTIGNNLIWLPDKIVITAQNEQDYIIERFPGEQYTYFSINSVSKDTLNLYSIEFLNTLTLQELPPHILALKINIPIMLLRNLDPVNGLCNRTRLIYHGLQMHTIDAEIVTGSHQGKHVFIPRIPLLASEDSGLPFMLERKQFPICLAFALTINKSQAMSRVHEMHNIKVEVENGRIQGKDGVYTQNVVFKEALNY
ncbi:36564_t:CDS:2 [Gigaspora margarita]|uniref:36564_t:CDS:1 n=1 Tax=Gigaspora margarita TaxID=4874 RepID=A0ABN7V5M3_GIGMA|nr:36564_t:CDS:2 [Gigaspora margarita]